MQHNVISKPLTTCIGRLTVATSFIFVPVTPAYAISAGEMAEAITVSPLLCLGLGCAAGAILGGLVAGLIGRRYRFALELQVKEALYAADEARDSALRTERALASLQATLQVMAQNQDQTAASEQTNVTDVSKVRDATSREGEDARANTAADSAAADIDDRGRSLDDIPSPEWEEDTDSVEMPMDGSLSARRPMSPAERAAVINRRAPRFDESLFPDLARESASYDVDDFELAMRAMDETLSATLMLSNDEDAMDELATGVIARRGVTVQDAQVENPEEFDAASYVDMLVQDEIERNRAGYARRFSRSHLTLFEGTGEISSTRRVNRPKPRHLAPAAQEA